MAPADRARHNHGRPTNADPSFLRDHDHASNARPRDLGAPAAAQRRDGDVPRAHMVLPRRLEGSEVLPHRPSHAGVRAL